MKLFGKNNEPKKMLEQNPVDYKYHEDRTLKELKEYIVELNTEIKRAENYISSKEKDRLNAESLFKK